MKKTFHQNVVLPIHQLSIGEITAAQFEEQTCQVPEILTWELEKDGFSGKNFALIVKRSCMLSKTFQTQIDDPSKSITGSNFLVSVVSQLCRYATTKVLTSKASKRALKNISASIDELIQNTLPETREELLNLQFVLNSPLRLDDLKK